jgi:hypothetical protein
MGVNVLELASKVHKEYQQIMVSNIPILLAGTKWENTIKHFERPGQLFEHEEKYGIGATCAEIALDHTYNEEFGSIGEVLLQRLESVFNPYHLIPYVVLDDGRVLVNDHGFMFDDTVVVPTQGEGSYVDEKYGDIKPIIVPKVVREGDEIEVQMQYSLMDFGRGLKFKDLYSFDPSQSQSADELRGLLDEAYESIDFISLQRRCVDEDGTPYLLKCMPYGGTGEYCVTKVKVDDAKTIRNVKDIESFEQFCELFGIKDEGKEMIMAANDELISRRTDERVIRDIREVWDEQYRLEN